MANQYKNKVIYNGSVLVDLTGDTAVAADVRSGKKFHLKSGAPATGTIADQAAQTLYPKSTDQTVSAGKYLAGAQTFKAVAIANLSAGNVKTGVTVKVGDSADDDRVASVTGTFTAASTISSGQTAATAAALRTGYSAFIDGAEIKGTIANQGASTLYPSTSDQTVAAGKFLSGAQTFKAVVLTGISAANIKYGATVKVGDAADDDRITSVIGTFTASNTVSSGQTAAAAGQIVSGYSAWVNGTEIKGSIASKTSSDVTVSGRAVTVPVGYYASQVTKTVAEGSATTPATTIRPISSDFNITVNSYGTITATVSKSQSITPTVSAGYVTSGTAGTVSVTGTGTKNLSVKGATTYTPTTTDQTISSGLYLTGAQTIKGDANLIAGNIKKDIIIFGVTGTYEGSSSVQSCTISLDDSTSVTIAFEKWMTWEDYVTAYPSGAISIDGNGVVRYTKNSVVFTVKYSGTAVQGTEKIVNGRTYTGTSTVLVTYQYYADPQNVMQSRVLNNGVELSYGSNYIKQGTVLSVQVWARGLYPTSAGVWLKGPSDTGYTQVYPITSVSADPQTYQFTVVDAGSIVIQSTYVSTQYVKTTYYSGYAQITVNA